VKRKKRKEKKRNRGKEREHQSDFDFRLGQIKASVPPGQNIILVATPKS